MKKDNKVQGPQLLYYENLVVVLYVWFFLFLCGKMSFSKIYEKNIKIFVFVILFIIFFLRKVYPLLGNEMYVYWPGFILFAHT